MGPMQADQPSAKPLPTMKELMKLWRVTFTCMRVSR